ncbi:MAG: metal ABC transporter ATP-binding protein [Firmicutes bacterium]|mgnify:CR=1 FL=1|nr:metal ABC transporter ATP-binding protein [Bacillota bacterium]
MFLNPVVETKDIKLSWNGYKILENINMRINTGDMIGIVGPNGAGKTTLLRIILGLLRPTSGEIFIFGRSPKKLGKLRGKIGYMPQRPFFNRRFPLSVSDVVAMGGLTPGFLGKPFSGIRREKIRRSLKKVDLLPLEKRPFAELSGGQQQRAFLARALCKEPLLLFLDEPNTGLDLPTQHRFYSLLEELQKNQGVTIVVVSHDLAMISRFADRLICINRTMHVHGPPPEVLNSPHLEKAYRCEVDIFYRREGG